MRIIIRMSKRQGKIIALSQLNTQEHEMDTARAVADAGYDVEFTHRTWENRVTSSDVVINGVIWEMKSSLASDNKAIERNLRKAPKQSPNIIVDSQRMKGASDAEIEKRIRSSYPHIKAIRRLWFINRNREIIDINCASRYLELDGAFQPYIIDVGSESDKLPEADLVIADLFIEYVGIGAFCKAIAHVRPKIVSCVLQSHEEGCNIASSSPYMSAFDGLDAIVEDVSEPELIAQMGKIGYELIGRQTSASSPIEISGSNSKHTIFIVPSTYRRAT